MNLELVLILFAFMVLYKVYRAFRKVKKGRSGYFKREANQDRRGSYFKQEINQGTITTGNEIIELRLTEDEIKSARKNLLSTKRRVSTIT